MYRFTKESNKVDQFENIDTIMAILTGLQIGGLSQLPHQARAANDGRALDSAENYLSLEDFIQSWKTHENRCMEEDVFDTHN